MIRCRIDIETLRRNRFAAFGAPAIIAVIDALERRGNAPELGGAPCILGFRHRLLLESVLTRKSADRLLVEFDDLARLRGFFGARHQFRPAFLETDAHTPKVKALWRGAHPCFSQRPLSDCFQ